MSKYIDPIFKPQFPYFNYVRRTVYKHPASGFTYKEWHHGYLGVIMIIVGLLIDFINIWIGSPILLWIARGLISGGLWNYFDDKFQHKIQKKEIELTNDEDGGGYYQSMTFLHWGFDWAYPLWEKIKRVF